MTRKDRHRAIVRAYQAGSLVARVRTCPQCGALPDAPCRTRLGKATRSHRARWASPESDLAALRARVEELEEHLAALAVRLPLVPQTQGELIAARDARVRARAVLARAALRGGEGK
jgi:hypothetical protein